MSLVLMSQKTMLRQGGGLGQHRLLDATCNRQFVGDAFLLGTDYLQTPDASDAANDDEGKEQKPEAVQ